jgi:hypothetical protein
MTMMYDFGNPGPGLGQAQKYIEYIEILNSITCGYKLRTGLKGVYFEVKV